MSEILEQSTDEVERLLAEIKSHGGEFVARDDAGGALAYGESEDELAIQLAEPPCSPITVPRYSQPCGTGCRVTRTRAAAGRSAVGAQPAIEETERQPTKRR